MEEAVHTDTQARADAVLAALKKRYPEPETMLDHATPWQLLVATVLAAQCTDARVNTVTPAFFSRWPISVLKKAATAFTFTYADCS